MARLLDNLHSGIEEPQRFSIGLVIHHGGQNPLEHGVPKERMREIHTSRLTEPKNDLLNTPSIRHNIYYYFKRRILFAGSDIYLTL
jgi:hypothetical protein